MTSDKKNKTIFRDVSWLSFNGRVLQEAADSTVPLRERVRFLGIFSNNLDEFFRVRVATLRRMISVGEKSKLHLENNAQPSEEMRFANGNLHARRATSNSSSPTAAARSNPIRT